MEIRAIFDRLWADYVRLNPAAGAVHDLLRRHGEQPANDHVAFRTYDLPGLDIETLSRHFIDRGYVHGGDYAITEKKVLAVHLEPPEAGLPKVFISHLLTGQFSRALQATVNELASQVNPDWMRRPESLWAGPPWLPVPFATYEALKGES